MPAQAARPVKPFTIDHRTVLAISVPMTIAYMSTPLLGLVDTAVVGQFGTASLIGGLAVGAIIVDLVFTTFNFLRAGTTGLVSQAFGAGDEVEQQAILYRALIIAVSSGFLMCLASPAILWVGLWFMDPGEKVAEATSTYFLIRMLSAPFALGNYAILGWLLGVGRSGLTLLVQLILNGTNILLSIYLGLWLGWQIEGVAIATIVGEVLAFIIGILLCLRLLDQTKKPTKKELLDPKATMRLINLNADIMIRSFALLLAFAYFTSNGAGFGETTLAANAILMHFFFISGYFLDGLATAAEQICGRAIGANYKDGFWKGFRLTALWNTIMATACVFLFLLFGENLIDLMSKNSEVRSTALVYLYWAAFIPLAGVAAFQLDGVFIGATWSRDMSIMMLLSLLIYILIWQIVKDPLQNHGLWLALHAFLCARAITLGARVLPNAKRSFSG